MSDEGFSDPGAVPEGGDRMNAKNLKNQVLLLKPTGTGMWDAKDAVLNEDGSVKIEAQGPRPYVVCDVWVLDRAGVVEEGTGVRFSWWKVVEQLKEKMGRFVGGMPVIEPGGKARIFVPLDDTHREVATKLVKSLHATPTVDGKDLSAHSDETF